jgi:glycosyltransferase involved in cell wall biosynthesis
MRPAELSVSTIVPVYNGARFLPDAIASVRRQRCPPLEIIVVDDGSTDETSAVVAKLTPDVRYEWQSNQGPAAARNRGLELARGTAIAFLDADDWWSDDKLEVQVEYLTANPSVEVVIGLTQLIGPGASSDGKTDLVPVGKPGIVTALGSALIRRSAFDRAGRFALSVGHAEDLDWFLRASEAGVSMVDLDQVTHYYRRHEQNLTNDRSSTFRYMIMALKRSLDRRRMGPEESARPLPPWLGHLPVPDRLTPLAATSPNSPRKADDRGACP